MRDSKFARAAAALVRPARGPGQGRTRGLRPVTRPGRAWVAAIAASLLVPAALAVTATAGPALASTAPLAITTTAPLAATAGTAFTAKLSATGGTKPYSWSLAGGTVLPAGLTLHAATGQITGTPTAAGASTFTVSVTDSENPPVTVTQAESITVTGGVTGGTFPVGNGPDAMAFDGTNMWVTNFGSNTVTELSPTGATLRTVTVGSNPDAIAFDGTDMWVADGGDNTVTELPPAG